MQPDPVRKTLQEQLWKRGVSLAEASVAIGRNKAYLQQYLARGMPRVLSHQDSATLGELLDCDPDLLRHAEIPAPKPWKRRKRRRPAGLPGAAVVPEMEVEAAAGSYAPPGEIGRERARWQIPEAMIRHEGRAEPAGLRILRLAGNAMEPVLREGDRLIVDTARRIPATGELFVLRDGGGIVVKRVERVRDGGPPRLRLISPNPNYPPSTCLAGDVEVVGKVIWTVRRE